MRSLRYARGDRGTRPHHLPNPSAMKISPRALLPLRNFFGFQRLNFLCAGFDGISFGVAFEIGVCRFDYAQVIEEKCHAARSARFYTYCRL